MAGKGRPKTGGRKPGSLNQATLAGKEFAERVYARLKKKGRAPEQISEKLLTCDAPAIVEKEHAR